ncbi:deoxyribodipyrimidine photo-lyase [Actinospica durhamensis]|uniref:Deoxyribodipyrimidine photo-lyase n=1 Tax=Actinospica durhamensis TaxID=1508375 RepID=A0A941ESE9_9ACTN|nr:deoxyribodipyrimidine photo-lyase [Actinospica durhamensis]MBR7835612.1 deoxyribodipyrimidine photo-lyase [Actinospica durhamensis]
MTALLWYRRDLRVHDLPALHAACDGHDRVVPVFCLDDRLLHGRHASPARTQFLLESLADLDRNLRELGSRLLVWRGRPEQALPTLARMAGATEIHATRDLTPFARDRGRSVGRVLQDEGIEFVAHPGLTVVDDATALRTKADTLYGTFTPFYRTWQNAPRHKPLPPPGMPPIVEGLEYEPLPTLADLGLEQEVPEPQPGGETAGLARAEWFLDGPVRDYAQTHDRLDLDGTSKLAPYLHFGCVSARELELSLPEGEGAEAFRRQLCWRDFYHYVHYHHPENARLEYQERYRHTIDWEDDEEHFAAWAAGRTGYPLVDAAMRQLAQEGWMHNRARMIVGCFLTKHLGIDWRRGEAHFMRLLLDGDQPNNNGNWQWIASVGVDPQPVYRRIFNPVLQQERHDPDGRYVRTYLPELARVPAKYLTQPWLMPADVQESSGCRIGSDYPEPIVDQREAREQALARYRGAAG